MRRSIIAVNISSEDVKLAEVSRENGEKAIRNLYHYRPGQDDRFSATDVLKKIIQGNNTQTLKTVLVMNSQDLDYRDFSFPFDSKKKVTGAIRFEISSEYPSDEYIVDHIESITREPGKKSFLAAIVSKEILKKRMKEAEDAGLQITGITSDISTLGNYFRDKDEALVMEMEERQTLFALYAHGVPVLVRDIPIGIKEICNDSGDVNMRKLRPLTGEIKRTIHSFNAKTGLNLSRIYVSGNILVQHGVLKALKKGLELDFVDQTPRNAVFQAENKSDNLNIYASVLGIAERKIKERSFNFFKEEFLKEEPGAIRRNYLRWGIIILVFFLFSVFFSSWLKIVSLEKRKAFLTTEIRKTFIATFPHAKRIVDEVRQAKNFLDARMLKLEEGDLPLEASILNALEFISRTIPEEINFQIINLFWEKGKIEINGKTDSFKTVNIIQELLTGSQNFSEATISNAKSSNDGQDVEFKITIRLAG